MRQSPFFQTAMDQFQFNIPDQTLNANYTIIGPMVARREPTVAVEITDARARHRNVEEPKRERRLQDRQTVGEWR
jgi:hypothetical protein